MEYYLCGKILTTHGIHGDLKVKSFSDFERFKKGARLYILHNGEYVMVKVIDIDKEHKQLRLSFKALSQNTRRYTKRVKFLGMPENIKGFGTIRDYMSKWIKGEYDD